jgi:heme A synthase
VTFSTGKTARTNTALLGALVGLTSLGVLLQGLWAGLFLPLGKGGNYNDSWVDVHNWGARIILVLAVATTVVALVGHRARRDLWIGALVLTVLLVIEGVLGAAISDGNNRPAAAIHVPLALIIMSLTVWLPLRARQAPL